MSVKSKTSYYLVDSSGKEFQVPTKKDAVTKYESDQFIGGNPYVAIIRKRHKKSEDGFWYVSKISVLKDRDGMVTPIYRRKSEKRNVDFQVE